MAQKVEAPRSVEAIAASVSAIRIYWLPTAGATKYRIWREGQAVAEVPAPTTDYEDTAIAVGSQHIYQVQAETAGGNSPLSPPYTERAFAPFPMSERRGKMVVLHFCRGEY